METLTNTTPKLKYAIALGSIGSLMHIIGLATTHWVAIENGHAGFWKGCFRNVCASSSFSLDWIDSCRAFGIIGSLSGCGAVILILCNLYVEQMKIAMVYLIAVIFNAVAVLSIIIMLSIGGGNFSDLDYIFPEVKISWSAGMTITALVLHLAAGILMEVDRREKELQQPTSHVTNA